MNPTVVVVAQSPGRAGAGGLATDRVCRLGTVLLVSDDLHVRPGLVIPAHELEWSFVASGGPGGQHANRSATKAMLRFNIETSRAIDDRLRSRLLEKLPSVVRVESSDERSQLQNRRIAKQRLRDRLNEALVRPTPRRPTRPSRRAKARRLDAKRRRSEVKRNRQTPRHD